MIRCYAYPGVATFLSDNSHMKNKEIKFASFDDKIPLNDSILKIKKYI